MGPPQWAQVRQNWLESSAPAPSGGLDSGMTAWGAWHAQLTATDPVYSSPPVFDVGMSGNPLIDGLLLGVKWGSNRPGEGVTLTYSFRTAETLTTGPGNFESGQGAWALNESEKDAVRTALAQWASVANIHFVEVPETAASQGDLRFGGTDTLLPGLIAETELPTASGDAARGDIWLGYAVRQQSRFTNEGLAPGTVGYMALAHEIGHALGLKHPQDPYGHYHTLPRPIDSQRNTVMSYNYHLDTLPHAPQALDIAAIQYLYGANTAFHAGDDWYQFSPTRPAFQAVWDAGGNNTLDASNQLQGVELNLFAFDRSHIGGNNRDGNSGRGWVSSNDYLTLAPGTLIQNAVGSRYDDTLVGNPASNTLEGGGGNDTLRGGDGVDYAVYRVADPAAGVVATPALDGSGVTHVTTRDGRPLLDYWRTADDALYVADTRRAQDIPAGQVNQGIDRLENIEHISLALRP